MYTDLRMSVHNHTNCNGYILMALTVVLQVSLKFLDPRVLKPACLSTIIGRRPLYSITNFSTDWCICLFVCCIG